MFSNKILWILCPFWHSVLIFLKLLYLKYHEMQTFKHLVLKKYPFVSVLGVLCCLTISLSTSSWLPSQFLESQWTLRLSLASVNMCLWCENGNLGWRSNAALAQFPACNPVQTYHSLSSLRMYLWQNKKAGGGKRKEPDRLWGNMFTASIGRRVQLRWPHCCYYRL